MSGGPHIEAMEVRTPFGVVTFVVHADHDPPFRCYGPDGIEVDPAEVVKAACPQGATDHLHGMAAFDLSVYLPKDKRRRRR